MVLNILVSVRQWLQFIYPSLVGTEVEVKYSIFLSKVYKGLYPHAQAKKKNVSSTSHPGVENSPCVPYWAWTSGDICLHVSSRQSLWSLWEELQGVRVLCRCCRIVVIKFNWGVSFSVPSSVPWLLFFCITLHARAWSWVFHQISGLFCFYFLFKYKSDSAVVLWRLTTASVASTQLVFFFPKSEFLSKAIIMKKRCCCIS